MRTKIPRRPLVSREEYIQRGLEQAFPGGQWLSGEGVAPTTGREVEPSAPSLPVSAVASPVTVLELERPTEATLPDGTPADPTNPKLKHAVQRTGLPAVMFARKSDATAFAAALIASAKEAGSSVGGNASLARWAVYPPNGAPWGMGIFSRPKAPKG
jgi:hypothetical protein